MFSTMGDGLVEELMSAESKYCIVFSSLCICAERVRIKEIGTLIIYVGIVVKKKYICFYQKISTELKYTPLVYK